MGIFSSVIVFHLCLPPMILCFTPNHNSQPIHPFLISLLCFLFVYLSGVDPKWLAVPSSSPMQASRLGHSATNDTHWLP
jgi:hypothetical protein